MNKPLPLDNEQKLVLVSQRKYNMIDNDWHRGYGRSGWCLCTAVPQERKEMARELIKELRPDLAVRSRDFGIGLIGLYNDSVDYVEVVNLLERVK